MPPKHGNGMLFCKEDRVKGSARSTHIGFCSGPAHYPPSSCIKEGESGGSGVLPALFNRTPRRRSNVFWGDERYFCGFEE